jgi:hypothetical protein
LEICEELSKLADSATIYCYFDGPENWTDRMYELMAECEIEKMVSIYGFDKYLKGFPSMVLENNGLEFYPFSLTPEIRNQKVE